MAGVRTPTSNGNGNEQNGNEKINLVNGSDVQFEYNNTIKSDSKKKKKKKKSKSKKSQQQETGETIRDLDFEDPDFEYPDSRILKQNSNGDVIVQSLEPNSKPKNQQQPPQSSGSSHALVDKQFKKKSNSASANGFIPEDQDDLNEQLKEYWASLSAEEKKELLNLERDSVFKVMKEQQKITCNCSVCGRKRQIIEQELKKLYDNYFDGIDTQELIAAELFNINNQQSYKKHQQQQQQQQIQSRSRKGSGTNLQQPQNPSQQPQQPPQQQQHSNQSLDLQRRNGIMSVAEDLLQNDGKKFLEMMEKLAESRIQRQNQYIRRNEMMNSNQTNNQIEEEEEEEPEYYDDEDEDEEDEEDLDEEEYEDDEEYEDGEDHHHTHSHSHSHAHHNHHHDHDHDHDHNHTHTHNHELEEAFEEDDEFNTDDEMERRHMIQLQLQRQRQLQQQLQRERQELAQLQDEYVDEDQQNQSQEGQSRIQKLAETQAQVQIHQQKLQELANQQKHHNHNNSQHTHPQPHPHLQEAPQQLQQTVGDLDIEEEEDDFEDDIEEEDEYSDDAIDEEQQLEEGRAMLQLCTTKMLRQSLLESYKRKKQEEYVNALLSELDEEKLREKQKEEKKQREKEKKREKKRIIQQQKEEERLKREAEVERLRKEKEEENKRKIEEGRRRKQEEERKKLEEKRRKEAEKREKEERKRQQVEAKKKKEEEEKRKKDEEKLRLQQQKEEEERLRVQKNQEEARRQQEILRLQQEQEELKKKQQEEDELRRKQQQVFARQQQERSNSNHSIPDQFSQPLQSTNPLLENLYHQSATPFVSSPLGSQAGLNTHAIPQHHHLRNDTPPGFHLAPGSNTISGAPGLDAQISHLTNPSATSMFTSRTFNENTVASPWNNSNGNGAGSNNSPSFFNPLDKSFNVFSQPQSQVPQTSTANTPPHVPTPSQPNDSSIDLLTNSLASTNFDTGNNNTFNSSFLTGSKVWSTSTTNMNSSTGVNSTWSSSTAKPLNGGGLWATPTQSHPTTQAPPPPSQLSNSTNGNFLPVQQQQPQPTSSGVTAAQPPSSSNVDQLVRDYQSQIYQAYTYLRSSFLEGGFISIDTLFTTFNSLQQLNSTLTFSLFLSVLKTKTPLYNIETIEEFGTITHVKITPYQQLNQLNPNIPRAGSLPFNQLGSGSGVGGNEGLFARRNTSLDTNGGLTWGSSLI